MPILWPPDVKSWLTGKDPDAGKDSGQKKGVTKDEMVGCHHGLSGHEFEQTLEGSEGQGSLVYCSPWSLKELDMTEHLNNSHKWEWALLFKMLLKLKINTIFCIQLWKIHTSRISKTLFYSIHTHTQTHTDTLMCLQHWMTFLYLLRWWWILLTEWWIYSDQVPGEFKVLTLSQKEFRDETGRFRK